MWSSFSVDFCLHRLYVIVWNIHWWMWFVCLCVYSRFSTVLFVFWVIPPVCNSYFFSVTFIFKFLFAKLSVSGTWGHIPNCMECLLCVIKYMHCDFFFPLTIDAYYLMRTRAMFGLGWLVSFICCHPIPLPPKVSCLVVNPGW